MPNRAERQRNGKAPAAEPAPALPVWGLVQVGQLEQVAPDGTKVAAIVFHLVDQHGQQLIFATDPPQPVTLVSQPCPIGRAVIVPGRPVARA